MLHDQYCVLSAHTNLLISTGIAMECLLINHLDKRYPEDLSAHIICLTQEHQRQLGQFKMTAIPAIQPALDLVIARAKGSKLVLAAWHNNQKRNPDQAEAALTLIQENIKELKVIRSTISDM
jgi:hypothetical protein